MHFQFSPTRTERYFRISRPNTGRYYLIFLLFHIIGKLLFFYHSYKMETTTLQTTQLNSILSRARTEVGIDRLPFIPVMKLSNKGNQSIKISEHETIDIPEQHFYISYVEENQDEGTAKRVIDIGENPEVVIIKRRYSYSFYSKTEDKLVAWTNEIDQFSLLQEVRIINNFGDAPFTEFLGTYFQFKKYKNDKYISKDGRQELRFRNILYIYFPNEFTDKKIFRLFVGNSSVTGVPEGEIQGSYKKPEPQSLLDFAKKVSVSEPNVFFKTKCRLGSKYHAGDIDYYMITFEPCGNVENFDEMANTWMKLTDELDIRFKIEFDKFSQDKMIIGSDLKEEAPLPEF